MRWFIFSILTLLCLQRVEAAELADSTVCECTKKGEISIIEPDTMMYNRRVFKYRKYWAALIPTHAIIQNAGNMGLISAGIGWSYGKYRQWETALLVGFIPKYHSTRPKITSTLKETYVPFRHYYRNGWVSELLTCGLYINTVYGHEFWKSQPGRYPDGYYKMLSTRFRANVFLGQRITKLIPYNKQKLLKSVSLFYEVSTCDLYIRAMFQSNNVELQDILGLSLGLKFQLL